MGSLKFVLPVYYIKEFKTKDDKTFFVGLNWYRNAYHHEQNEVKNYYHKLVSEQYASQDVTSFKQFKLEMEFYYKNPASDGHNVTIIEKFVLDAIQELNIVPNDTVKHHLGTTWNVAGQDKLNPRIEITVVSIA